MPEQGQMTVEFVGTLPLLFLVALICIQALLLALGVVFVQSAADRAARGESQQVATASIPSGWRKNSKVVVEDSTARAAIHVPTVVPGVGRFLVVRASSEVVK